MRLTRNPGLLVLSLWLIVTGLAAFIPAFHGLGVFLPLLAIAAGALILLAR